ncbi:carboxylic ester hydrolase [Pigmentiphaga litoralis]|uniref:carboxylesterase family protein n=1 Tax=Pigmentiphaga litoralis TaxID=516702 RepID=UPI0019A0519F|nr:carboxylesterase family protein [Pigmentiphaga litoralis]GGX02581.1 carboxylic ester hydrolase [Pigmentiphaga litoralis]
MNVGHRDGHAKRAWDIVWAWPALTIVKGEFKVQDSVIATFGTATVRGVKQAAACRFSAIPYAEPPVGARRFLPPVPRALQGNVDATRPGPVAPQLPSRLADAMGDFDAVQSEDCLHLTIWTPAPDTARRPVVIWLHGGAWQSGGGAIDWYDGSRLVSEGDVVVVNINYRLAALGWLCVPGEPANVGLLDCEAAIDWVADHITAFGGDPARITVMGQSAGGSNIASLLTRQPRFHRAIIQSGSMGRGYRTRAQADTLGLAFLKALGVTSLDEARALPVQALLDAQRDSGVMAALAQEGSGRSLFCAVLDGTVLPLAIDADLAAAPGKVDLLIGSTEDEMAAFPGLGRDADSRAYGDRIFAAPAAAWAQAARAAGRNAWRYQFAFGPSERFGACHCIELPFMFGNVDAYAGAPMLEGMTAADADRLVAQMLPAWLRFIRGDSPGWAQAPALQTFT